MILYRCSLFKYSTLKGVMLVENVKNDLIILIILIFIAVAEKMWENTMSLQTILQTQSGNYRDFKVTVAREKSV